MNLFMLGTFYEFTFENGKRIIWDIAKAEKIVGKGIRLIEVPREQAEIIVCKFEIEPAKLAKADYSFPGICAPIKHYGDDHESLIIIDGVHRAVKAYQDYKPFFVRQMTAEDSKKCIVLADDWSRIP